MTLHDRFGIAVLLVAVVAAVAAVLVSFVTPRYARLVKRLLRFMPLVVGVQVVLGLVLVATGSRPAQLLHWFYGAAVLLTMPLALSIGGRLGPSEERYWVAGGAVITVLFALRAIATG